MAEEGRSSRAWIFDFVTMVAVLLGVVYGAIELRQYRSQRQTEAVLELHRTILTPEYVRAVNMIMALPDSMTIAQLQSARYGPDKDLLLHLIFTYESLGFLVHRGDISLDSVDELYRYGVTTTWRKLKPLVVAERVRLGYPAIGEWLQWLAERLDERQPGGQAPAYEVYRSRGR